MSETKFDKAFNTALELKFVPFENNIERNEKLAKLKAHAIRKVWEYEDICRKKENELIASDIVQEGKNQKARDAILEIEKSKVSDFDILENWKRVLRIVHIVTEHNDRFIKLLNLEGE